MVGKYPAGWNAEQVDELVGALGRLASSAVGAVEEGVEMLPLAGNVGAQAATPQERLIRACNQELSKALTSQTLATEIQGQGSRAASETHLAREQTVHVSDRAMVSATLNRLFRWVTDLNLGPDVPSPTHHFYEQDDARADWAELVNKVRHFLPLKKSEVYERLSLTPPAEGDEVIAPPAVHADGGAEPRGGAGGRGMKFGRCRHCGGLHFQAGGDDGAGAFEEELLAALDDIIVGGKGVDDIGEDLAKPILAADPAVLQARLAEIYPDIDTADLQDTLARLIFAATLLGRAAADENNG